MKRTVALAILAALLLTLCACGKVRQAEEAIDAIGNVTAESGAQIEAAEAAVEALNDKQRDKLPNLTVLEEAQTEYETVLEEQAVTEACVQGGRERNRRDWQRHAGQRRRHPCRPRGL